MATSAQASAQGFALTSNIMVPMRDGVRLATDIYRPAQAGTAPEPAFPVILERTPYDKADVSRAERSLRHPESMPRSEVALAFVERGYVVVIQDCRGRYGSEGEFVKYLSDGHDGEDTMAWIMAQPWCNGRVGTLGLSYAAHTQSALACLNPAGLACMVLDSGGFSNAYQSGIRQGGAFELKQATWAFKHARVSPYAAARPEVRAALEAEDISDWFHRMPWKRGHSPLKWAPDYEDYLFEQWCAGTFGDYWRQLGIYGEGYYEQYADVPIIFISSWYDPYPRTAVENFRGLSARKQSPMQLILGPWTHGDRTFTHAGDVDFGPQATLDGNLAEDYLALRLRWFDRWLLDQPNGAEADARVRVFVMGGGSGRKNAEGRLEHGGRWRSANDWPLPETRFTNFYLHGSGLLSPEEPPAGAPPLAYDYDPHHPVPTIGGNISSGEPIMAGGAFDQREGPRFFGSREPYLPLAARPDILVFETLPLESDLEVTGPIEVFLWVASNCPDSDFTAKLIDVYPASPDYPQGFAMNLTGGILRARYRDDWSRPEPMSAGEVYRIRVEAMPTGNLFKAGHRIRLDISSSNFPHFDINPNTGEPEGLGRTTRIATNRVFVERARPSHVVLPVIPS